MKKPGDERTDIKDNILIFRHISVTFWQIGTVEHEWLDQSD
jgi:hypothetical protein